MDDTMSGMTMSMSGSATATMSGMSMATSTDGSMNMSSSEMMMMGMDEMMMVFFTSSSTSLFSASWTPTTTGQYAGTCIFLIALATIFRAILAIRVHSYRLLAMAKQRRSNGFGYVPPDDTRAMARPWRANEAVTLAAVDVLIAGIGYLLMIAVMTMNVGYFLSVLAGVFLGSLIFGRFLANSAVH